MILMNMYYFWMSLFIYYTCMQRNLINSNSNSKMSSVVEYNVNLGPVALKELMIY